MISFHTEFSTLELRLKNKYQGSLWFVSAAILRNLKKILK